MTTSRPQPSADLPLPYLDTFCAAAELESFTAAARRLGLTQAAVSQRIHELEKVLSASLFLRRGGRVRLAPAGRKLYPHAQRILELQRQARQEISGQPVQVTGTLALAASSIPGEHLLPPALSLFRQRYPGIHVRASVTDSDDVLAQLEKGQVEIGLVGKLVHRPFLEFRHFARDHMLLVVSPKHRQCRRHTVSVKELTKLPLILREVGSGLRHCFETASERAGLALSDFTIVLELGSNEAIKEAILQGAGVAILSAYAVQKERERRHLHVLDITDLECDRDIFLVRHSQRVTTAPARFFLAFMDSFVVPPLGQTCKKEAARARPR